MDAMEEFFAIWNDDGTETSREQAKRFVLSQLSPPLVPKQVGTATYELDGKRIHVRQTNTNRGPAGPFDINPTTLRADYELWICGTPSLWYLIPIAALRYMQSSPSAYRNSARRSTTIVTIDEDNDSCRFAAGEPPLNLSEFRHADFVVRAA